jgi:hypothetical protein
MNQLRLFQSASAPLIISYGMGVDSTALLVGLAGKGIRPDAILFADTGSEKPATYDYGKQVMPDWLASVGFPEITWVRYQPQNFKNWPPYHSLEENCLTNSTLPSLAFGFKSCSQKWKIAPQNKWTAAWMPAREAWADGVKVRKTIGYDSGPADLRRRNHLGEQNDPLFAYEYPLIEWGWDRNRCKEVIAAAGLPIPEKSACYFCPATKPHELHTMPKDLLRRIIMIESRAAPRLGKVEGLWRSSTKTRPGRMTDYIKSQRLLDPDEVESLIAATPTQPIYQDDIPNWKEFINSTCETCTLCSTYTNSATQQSAPTATCETPMT